MNFVDLDNNLQLAILTYVDEWTLISFRETNKKFWNIIEREDDLYQLKSIQLFQQDTKLHEDWLWTYRIISWERSSLVRDGKLPKIKELYDKGIFDVHFLYSGLTCLMMAAMNGHVEVAKFLVEHGADVNTLSLPESRTALHFAIVHGKTDMVKYLLAQGADMEIVTLEDESPVRETIFDVIPFWAAEIKEVVCQELERRQPVFGEEWQEMMGCMEAEMDQICIEVEC